MLPYTKKIFIPFYILITLLITFSLSMAAEFESSETVHISNIHVIEGDLYAWGEKITIDGEVKGDIFTGGENISINGFVENSVHVFSNKFSSSGEINGSLRLFANDVMIDGTIKRSGLFFCNSVKIGKNAVFGQDIDFRGGNIDIDGTVHGDVTIHAGTTIGVGTGISVNRPGVYISGTIDGDVTIYGNNIHIIPPALIKGDLKYISKNQASIDINSGVTILGNTTWDLPENSDENSEDSMILSMTKTGARFLGAFLFGTLVIMIGKKYISAMVSELQERMAISVAIGFISLAVIVAFVIILVLALALLITGLALLSKGESVGGSIMLILSTIIIPLSSITIVTLSSIMYSGKIIVALLIGLLIMKKVKSNPAYLSKTQLLIGLFFTYLLFEIPYIGFLIFVIISLIGTGAIILGIKNCNKELESVQKKDQVGI